MKTSFVLSASPTQFSAITYSADLERSIAGIAELGFDGVELGVRDPSQVDVRCIARATGKFGLEVCAIGTGQAYGEEALSFCDPNVDVRRKAVRRIMQQIDLASALGAHLIIGLIRGRTVECVQKTQALAWVREALLECAAGAEDKNVGIVIEPINRYETDLLNTVPETLDFIEQLGSSCAALLIDTFHMNIEEASIFESIERAGPLIAHVHAADSNRWAPGCGHLDFREIVATLRQVGYNDYVSAEILPLPDPETAVKTAARNLRSLTSPTE